MVHFSAPFLDGFAGSVYEGLRFRVIRICWQIFNSVNGGVEVVEEYRGFSISMHGSIPSIGRSRWSGKLRVCDCCWPLTI